MQEGTYRDYWEAMANVNEILEGYFAIFDQDVILIRRKKIQKILEIHNALYQFNNLSKDAELCLRQYMNNKVDGSGNRVYTKEKFKSDIKRFCMAVDNFMGEGKYFVIYLDDKIRELQKLI